MPVSAKILQRLRNYLIWRTKILNGGFLNLFAFACVSLLDFLLHVRIYLVVFGVGENQLPGKVVVGANNIYHVDNVTIWPLRFSASTLFFPRDQIFIVNFRSKKKSFLLNLTLPSVTPSWIACLSLRKLNTLT